MKESIRTEELTDNNDPTQEIVFPQVTSGLPHDLHCLVGRPLWPDPTLAQRLQQDSIDTINVDRQTSLVRFGVLGLLGTLLRILEDKETSRKIGQKRAFRRDFLRYSLGFSGVVASISTQPLEAPLIALSAPSAEKLKPVIVKGIEVYGLAQKIDTEDTLQQLYSQVEADYEYGGGRERSDPDVRYLELFVDREVYLRFEEGGEGTFATWANRHIEKLNEMITAAVPPSQLKTALKRIVVLDPSFRERADTWSWSQFPQKVYKKNECWDSKTLLPDVDGRWYLPYEVRSVASYYDYEWHYDRGLDHELGHYLLYLEDLYLLNFWLESAKTKGLVPDELRGLFGADYLMTTVGDRMDMWSSLVLEYMRKNRLMGRDKKVYERYFEIWNLSNTPIPKVTHLTLKYPDGQPMAECQYQIIRLPVGDGGKYQEDKIRVILEGKLDKSGILNIEKDMVAVSESDFFYHQLLVIKTPNNRTYYHILNRLPFSIKYLCGETEEASLSVDFRDYQKNAGIQIFDEDGNPLYTDGKVFYYEDSNGQVIKDDQGQPIICSFGEFGVGVYRLKNIKDDGFQIIQLKTGTNAFDYYSYKVATSSFPRIWYSGGMSYWEFSDAKNIPPINRYGHLQSIIPLPYNQALVHRWVPRMVIVRKGKDGKDNYNDYPWENFKIIMKKLR